MRIISLTILLSLIICGCNSTAEKKKLNTTNDCAFLKELIEPSDSAIEININEFDTISEPGKYNLIKNKIQSELNFVSFKFKILDSVYKLNYKDPRLIICGLFNYINIRYINKDSIFILGNNIQVCNSNDLDSVLFQMEIKRNSFESTQIYLDFNNNSKNEIQHIFTKVKRFKEKLYSHFAFNRFKTNICNLNILQKDSFKNEFNIWLMFNDRNNPIPPPPPTIEEYLKNVRHSRHH